MEYEIAMALAFIVIFIITHYIFKNITEIFLWACKIITATYLWVLLWVLTQLHRLPEWQEAFSSSVYNLVELVNFTKTEL
jgi:membrane protein YdbS with pleckstrin-like domain